MGSRLIRPTRHHATPWKRRIAQFLCIFLGLVGAAPLLAAALLKNARVQQWTNRTTEALLRSELGLEASYRARLSLWPLELDVEDLVVASVDRGAPALRVKSVKLRPRLTALLAGQINLGEVQIVEPQVRAVIRNGSLANVALRIPERRRTQPARKTKEPPITSLAVTHANADIDLDGKRIRLKDVNADVFAKRGPTFEISLTTAQALADMDHLVEATKNAPEFRAYDEDVICKFELQAHVDPQSARIKRLVVQGFADLNPAPNTRADCQRVATESDTDQISIRLHEVIASWPQQKLSVAGKLAVRVPVAPVNRFVSMLPVQGWVAVNGAVKWDETRRLPEFTGHARAAGLQLERYKIADLLDADVLLHDDVIHVKDANVIFADGRTLIPDARIAPFEEGVPLNVPMVETHGMTFPGLMRALGVTPRTIVAWDFGDGQITDLKGQLATPHLEGDLRTDTRGFEVFNSAFNDPARKHMIGVPRALVHGKIVVEPDAFEFRDTVATFGSSQLNARLVSIGFDNDLEIVVDHSTQLDLADISPIVNIPMAGHSRLGVHLVGKASDPLLTGSLSVDDFEFGGFPLGSIKSSQVRFRPLVVDFSDIKATKGKSDYSVKSARLDFNTTGVIIADAQASSTRLDIRDFLNMWNFDRDPRYDSLFGWGKANARVHYVLGGPEDRCGDGLLRVTSQVSMSHLELYEERYDSADADVDFTWMDIKAGFMGVNVNVPSLTLRKGMGVVVGSLQIRPGAQLTAHAAATAIPLGRFNGFGTAGRILDGTLAGVADASGTLDAPEVEARVNVSRLFVGRTHFGPSELTVRLESPPRPANLGPPTRCNNPIAQPFDLAEYKADKPSGTFHFNGQMLGGQIKLDDLQMTRQQLKHVKGTVELDKFQLSVLNELLRSRDAANGDIAGFVSGEIEVDDLPMDNAAFVVGSVNHLALELQRGAAKITVEPMTSPITFKGGTVEVPDLSLHARYGEIPLTFQVAARVSQLQRTPNIAAELRLVPADLARFVTLVPRAEALTGRLDGNLKLAGPWGHLKTSGSLQVGQSALQIKGLDSPFTDIDLAVAVSDGELRITRGSANLGMGKVQLSGGGSFANFQPGVMRLGISANDVALPAGFGLKGTLDAQLEATVDPSAEVVRPHVTGAIILDGLEYARPVQMTADVSSLAQRGRRSQVEAYDPENDKVDFDLFLRAKGPLRIRNDLIETEVTIDKAGLELTGTNQRFGLRGALQTGQAGKIYLRQHVFEIREGTVVFDDPSRINPRVDLRATTEYRRYTSQNSAPATGSGSSGSGDSARTALGGRWRITMHAHGDADQLSIDLTSEPALSPDDIFMLLTVGVTRTEINQAQSASVVSSVALEALGTLSGADRTVRNTIPVIDDFRFGSAYSSRTGRTEPTVTIGKRLSERIRATVTTGLAESREVRSNLEWQLNRRLSLEGSYDNVNDISSSQLGNLGADIRWRIEFK